MSRKILFMLMALSIIPVARSCDVTFGYPLPVMENVSPVSFGPVLEELDNYEPVRSTVFLFINLAALFLFARFLLRRVKSVEWLSSVYEALLVVSFVQWSGFLFLYVPEPKGGGFKALGEAYWRFIEVFSLDVPARLSNQLFDGWLEKELRDTILFRAWLTFVIVVLVFVFYGLGRLWDLIERGSKRKDVHAV